MSKQPKKKFRQTTLFDVSAGPKGILIYEPTSIALLKT